MYVAEIGRPVSDLPGVGASRVKDLARLGVGSVGDILLHVPRGYEDRRTHVPLIHATPDRPVNTVAEVVAHSFIGGGPRRTLKVHIRDESGIGALVCFGRNFLARSLPEGKRIRVYGTFLRRYGDLQATAFEFENADESTKKFDRILPIYPLAGKLTQGDLRKATAAAVKRYGRNVASELPEDLRARRGLLSTAEALEAVHTPADLESARAGHRTLVYLELFFLQLAIGMRASERRRSVRPALTLPRGLSRRLLDALPFDLTVDQKRVLEEIVRDLEADVPMARLLQGDVGSGKTILALLSALCVVEAGHQVALMAPTELLARQHADAAARLFALASLDVSAALLSGAVPPSARKPLLKAIATGGVDLVIGTHAVFTPDVTFRNLRYVIIDEQHRFGVLQRMALTQKAREPDVLFMTATPIPRTLALTVFGDMQVGSIRTMPAGRKPIETHLARHGNDRKVYEFVRRELAAGHQAYFVYPRIDDTGALDLRDAESMWRELAERVYPEFTVGLVHSRIQEEEKRETMERFRTGELRVLVATSVVEVGVDVPNATCMVVEHAERFGLAALHQLRGRVGRGEHQSYCFLVYDEQLTDVAKERLKVMHRTTDGFEIAEEDLRIRGPGDIAGTQQAGYLRFRVADLGRDMSVMNEARADAFDLLERDPFLAEERHAPLAASLEAARETHRTTPFSYPETAGEAVEAAT
ncbi:MAG: ATP-dependent DNA helicase RecG [Spirochaetota bacterium]